MAWTLPEVLDSPYTAKPLVAIALLAHLQNVASLHCVIGLVLEPEAATRLCQTLRLFDLEEAALYASFAFAAKSQPANNTPAPVFGGLGLY